MEQYRSVCPYDCPDACGLVVSVENGRVISGKGRRNPSFHAGDHVSQDGAL